MVILFLSMKTFTLRIIRHRQALQLMIDCSDKSLNNSIRRIPGIAWSQTYKNWYLPYTDGSIAFLKHHLGESVVLQLDTMGTIQATAILIEKKQEPDDHQGLCFLNQANRQALSQMEEL